MRMNSAVSVVTRDELAAAQVISTQDIGRVLPQVQYSSSGSMFFPAIALRGVTSAQDFYNPAITVYVDGVPQLPPLTSQAMINVEQVELLKGSQGTLFGKSAEGGVLNIVTRVPDNTPHASVSAGWSSRNGYLLKGDVSGPLVKDLLYGSASVITDNAPGNLNNPATGETRLGGARTQGGSAKLRLAPAGSPWEAAFSFTGECTRASQDAYVPYDDINSRTVYVAPGMPMSLSHFTQKRCSNGEALSAQRDFGDWRLTAVASWQNVHYQRDFPILPYASHQPESWQQQTQEIRLFSRAPGRSWDAVTGIYRQRVDQSRVYSNDIETPISLHAFDSQSQNRTESLAWYGNATWHATDKLDLTGGLRVSHDQAQTSFVGHTLNYATFGYDAFTGSGKTSGNTVLGTVSAGYQLTPAWRVYANVGQGYKPGGYNLAPSSLADATAYGKERSLSYELGTKFDNGPLTFNAAVYRTDIRNAQLYTADTLGYQSIKNVGKSRSTGIEGDVAWQATRQWRISLGGYVNRATFTEYASSAACAACTGNRVPFSPRYGLSAALDGELDSPVGKWLPHFAVRRVGPQDFDVANTLGQDAYTVFDASVAWQARRDTRITLYALNLTNRLYRTYAFSGGAFGNFAQINEGRTLGVNVAFDY